MTNAKGYGDTGKFAKTWQTLMGKKCGRGLPESDIGGRWNFRKVYMLSLAYEKKESLGQEMVNSGQKGYRMLTREWKRKER